jgi:hypothetical protein
MVVKSIDHPAVNAASTTKKAPAVEQRKQAAASVAAYDVKISRAAQVKATAPASATNAAPVQPKK